MPQQTIYTALLERFGSRKPMPKAALMEFLEGYFGKAKPSTLAWRLHELTQEGTLVRTGYGVYQINDRPSYQPDLSPTLRQISERIKAQLPFIDYCAWDTRILADLMIQQPMSMLQLIEVERVAVESVYLLLERNPIKIDRYNLALYRYEDWLLLSQRGLPSTTPVIVKPLITEAPLQKQDGYVTAPLEKILVDLMADRELFFAYQEEIPYMIHTAWDRFMINHDKFRRYARRRNRLEQVEQLLGQLPDNP